jgi:L-lactate dehydrogenase complex protein LldG
MLCTKQEGKRNMTAQDLFSRFQQQLTAIGGECHYAYNAIEAAMVITEHLALAQQEIVIPIGFSRHPRWGEVVSQLFERGVRIRTAGSLMAVVDAPAGLSAAELAIAETGSVLFADRSLEERSVSMLSLAHFVLVSEDMLVSMLDDAVALLRELTRPGPDQRHYVSLVTGPSRNPDIESVLAIGVQRPKVLCVIVVAARK